MGPNNVWYWPRPNDDGLPVTEAKVTLKNKALWQKFSRFETEMIITKSGRRMFPTMQVEIKNLDPQAHYCVYLEMDPAARCRFKYSSAGGWAPAGSEESQSPLRIYLHPDSPAKGEYWMDQSISFSRLKLTNTIAPPMGQIVLQSMHKYSPRIIIAKTADPGTTATAPKLCVEFLETQFIAVTAYQNEKITQLKIDYNPFAKGFRQDGQAKCKRKRRTPTEDDEDELICVTDEPDESHEHSKKRNSSSESTADVDISGDSRGEALTPRSRTSSEGDRLSVSTLAQRIPSAESVQTERETLESIHPPAYFNTSWYMPPAPASYYPYVAMPYICPPPFYYPYGGYYSSNMEEKTAPLLSPPQISEKPEVNEKRPRKLTDFSIDSIMNMR